MRRFLILIIALYLVLSGGVVFGAEGDQLTVTGFRVDADGDTTAKTVAMTTGQYRQVDLPLLGFYIGSSTTTAGTAPVAVGIAANATTPYLISTGYRPYLYYELPGTTHKGGKNNRTGKDASPIVQTFRVPDDYLGTSAAFVITVQHNPSATSIVTPCYIDWDIVINRDGKKEADLTPTSTYTRYNQTPVTLPFTVGAASSGSSLVEQVSLTYATPTGISAGDLVTVRIWPAPQTSTGSTAYSATQQLRIYGVAFKYLAQW